MTRLFGFLAISVCAVCFLLGPSPASFASLEEGNVKGRIEGVDGKFLRDYETLDYKGEKDWKTWGVGRRSLGWIKVQGESGELKDLFLLIVNNRTRVLKPDGTEGCFSDFKTGQTVQASYRMGWDALHADEVKILK